MKKTAALVIAFGSLVVSTLAFSAFTFAWIDYSRKVANPIVAAPGSVTINSLSYDVYKVTYNDPLNWQDGGKTYTKDTNPTDLGMNILDPSYIKIVATDFTVKADRLAVMSALDTGIVIKVSVNLTYSSNIQLVVSATRPSTYTLGADQFRASSYLRFLGLVPGDIAVVSTNEEVYSAVKAYAETQTVVGTFDHPGSVFSNDTEGANLSLTNEFYSNSSFLSRPNVETTADASFYAYIEYSDDKTYPYFYDADRIGETYSLLADYSLLVSVKEAN